MSSSLRSQKVEVNRPDFVVLLDAFLRDSFAVIPTALDESQCDAITACVDSYGSGSPGTRSLLAEPWCRALVMRPLALHTSSKATGTSRRRVLHFVFGPAELPYGLQWEHAAD
jgi:hypothetical protein